MAWVYITHGTEEYTPYVNALLEYQTQLLKHSYSNIQLTIDSVEGMRHVGMTSEGFLRGLLWAFRDNIPEGPSGFEKMHEEAALH